VDEGITRRASIRLFTRLRGMVIAALAATVLVLAMAGVARPAPARASATTAYLTAVQAAKTRHLSKADRIRLTAWRFARRQQGKPYIWGGTGPQGYDCSGLVYAAYRHAGVRLPRTTYEMLASWLLVRIPKWQARRGDLAFYGSGHVELYAWGNLTFGAATTGTLIGFHVMNAFWQPTMYFRVR
jgi:cell wall-associated NlpC family hydrolase